MCNQKPQSQWFEISKLSPNHQFWRHRIVHTKVQTYEISVKVLKCDIFLKRFSNTF